MTQELRRKLRAERKRTGIAPRDLVKARHDIPKGFLPSHVSRWESGIERSAPKAHVDYILMRWSSLEDDAGRVDTDGNLKARPGRRHPKAGEEWISISVEMREQLQQVIQRSGFTVRQVAELPMRPPDLSARMVNAWLHNESHKARKHCWEFVMAITPDVQR